MAALSRPLARAAALFAGGRYFDAHEELETPWKAAHGDEKLVLQGVIQLAAGLHRLRQNPVKPSGAHYLLERGLEKLERGKDLLEPASLAELKAAVAAIRAAGEAPAAFRLGLRAVSG